MKVGCACSGKPFPTSPSDERRLARALSRFRSPICCPHASRRDTRPGCLSSIRRSNASRTGRQPLGMYTSCKAVSPTSLCKCVHWYPMHFCQSSANRIPKYPIMLEDTPKLDHFPADCRSARHAGRHSGRRCQALPPATRELNCPIAATSIVSAHPQSSRLMLILL